MAAVPPASERRRPRRGSLERPVNGRLYRGTWLLVGLPLLLLAFSVARPAALQAPTLPPAFDKDAAAALAADLASTAPNRLPGTPGATQRRRAGSATSSQPYGITVRTEAFSATVPGRGRVRFVNLLAAKAGLSQKTIVVMAHRDDSGAGPGANDNASGTAALRRARARLRAVGATPRASTCRTASLFLSTDGAVYGGLGAAWFAAHAPEAADVIAVDQPRLDRRAASRRGSSSNADTPRSPTPGLVETVRAQLAAETGARSAARRARSGSSSTSASRSASTSRRRSSPAAIPAVTITTAATGPRSGARRRRSARLRATRLGQVGRATQNVIDALQQGVALAPGPSSYIYLGSRIVRGWAVELVLVGALLPFLAATVDLFARCRRRRIRVAPALRSYRSRLGFWALVRRALRALRAARRLAAAARRGRRRSTASRGRLARLDRRSPCSPASAGSSPATGCCRGARVRAEEELAGHAAALLALGVVALLVVATNPFALIFLLPSLHVWLWLPQVRESPHLGARLPFSSPGSRARCSCSGRSPIATASAGTHRGTSPGSSRSGTRRCPAS